MGTKRRGGTNSVARDGTTTSKDADTTSREVTPWMFWGVAIVAVVLAVAGSTTLLPATLPSRQQQGAPAPSAKASASARSGIKVRQYKDPVPHTVESVFFSASTRYGTFQTVEAFVVHDFLPIDLANRWRDALLEGGVIASISHQLLHHLPLHHTCPLSFFLSIKKYFLSIDSICTHSRVLALFTNVPCASSTVQSGKCLTEASPAHRPSGSSRQTTTDLGHQLVVATRKFVAITTLQDASRSPMKSTRSDACAL